MHMLSAKSGDGVALMFRKVVATLSGVPVTQAEIDQMQAQVLTADVVDHADAPQRAVKGGKGKRRGSKATKGGGGTSGSKAKSGLCSIQ